eukprot:Colp12_sorted_trinity150504_noHs@20057
MANAHEHFEFVEECGGIKSFKHKTNGLNILILEDSSAPVATVMITYHVGSRNEAVGYTGSTHLLEHLMFKGSEKFNKEKGTGIWEILQKMGAQINATTWRDRTNYYELLPKEFVKDAIAIEADRMRGAFIREEDRRPEMTVVRNEYEVSPAYTVFLHRIWCLCIHIWWFFPDLNRLWS